MTFVSCCAGPKRAKLSPSRAKTAPYGPPAVAGQETEVPGKDGLLYPRTIYHLQQDRAVCLLDLREFCKVRAVSSSRTSAVLGFITVELPLHARCRQAVLCHRFTHLLRWAHHC